MQLHPYESHYGSSESFVTIAERFEAACAWLHLQGVEVENNRLNRYRKSAQRLAQAAKTNSMQSLVPEFEAFAQHLFDIQVILQIFKGLSRADIVAPRDKLVEITKGVDLLSQESTKNNLARNTSFELEVAATLAHEFPPRFGTPDCPCDLFFEREDYRVFVECKRPWQNFQNAVKEGYSQLRRRYSSPNDRGIVAIACSKIIGNSDGGFLAKNKEHLSKLSVQCARDYMESQEPLLPPAKSDQTISIVLHFRVLSTLGDGTLWMDQTFLFHPLCPRGSPDRRIMAALVDAVDSFRAKDKRNEASD